MIYIARVEDNMLLAYNQYTGMYFHRYVTRATVSFDTVRLAEKALEHYCTMNEANIEDYRLVQD